MWLRKLVWKILGINYYKYLESKKNINLKDASWVDIGKSTYDNGAYVWRWSSNSKLAIGNFCSIANDVHFICDSGYHTESKITSFPLFHELLDKNDFVIINSRKLQVKDITKTINPAKQNIDIGNDVWIGPRVTILPNVSIGNGVTILAGSVVSDNLPDYSIVGGIPAKILSYKYDFETINKLNTIKWWDWETNKIKTNIDDFYLPINDFLNKHI